MGLFTNFSKLHRRFWSGDTYVCILDELPISKYIFPTEGEYTGCTTPYKGDILHETYKIDITHWNLF